MSAKENLDEAIYQLRKALALGSGELRATHPWFLESERWKELLVALLIPTTHLPEHAVRPLVRTMGELGLL